MPPITVATDVEDYLATETRARSKDNPGRIRLPTRHRRQAGLDKGDSSWQGRLISLSNTDGYPKGLLSGASPADNGEVPKSPPPHLRAINLRNSWAQCGAPSFRQLQR
jgi:hypothetical protein